MNFQHFLIIITSLMTVKVWSQHPLSDSSKKLNEVTIIANRLLTLPGSGDVIGNSTIQKVNDPNVLNVLRILPGINVRDEEGYGLRPNIGLRGTAVNRSAKITLMEDGILIAPAPYSDPAAYYFPTFSRMNNIEVLKGSSQIAYGPYTIGGVVNMTSTPIPNAFRGYAQLGMGSFKTNQQRVWLGDSRDNIEYLVELNRLASDGFRQLDNGGHTGFDRRDMMAKLRWKTSSDAHIFQSIGLKVLNTTEDSKETYLGLTQLDFVANPLRRYSGTQNDRLDMNHQHLSIEHIILPISGLDIKTTGYYSRTFRDWARANSINGTPLMSIISNPSANESAYQTLIGLANGTVEYQSAARTYHSIGVQLQSTYSFTTRAITHQLELGLRLHYDESDRYATRSEYAMNSGTMVQTNGGILGNVENQVRKAKSLATYLSYQIRLKGLTLSPGVRLEHIKMNIDNYGTNDNARIGSNLKSGENIITMAMPGIGIDYQWTPNINIFGGVHRGFSPPGAPSTSTQGGQARAESAMVYELGYRYHGSKIGVSSALFLNEYQNILGSDAISGGGAGTGNMYNAGKATTKGLEISTDVDIMKLLEVRSSYAIPIRIAYTYTHSRFSGVDSFKNAGGDWGSGMIYRGDHIPFISPHQFSWLAGLSHSRWNVTLSGRYTGPTRIKPGKGDLIFPDIAPTYQSTNAIRALFFLDLSANYRFNHILSIYSTIGNLTNNQRISANLPQGYRANMPTNINLGIKVDF